MARKTNSQKQTFWQKQVKDWQESGLKISLFCRKHKLTQAQFLYWRRKLASQTIIQEDFVEVKPDMKSLAVIYEITLAEGMSVRVGAGFDPEVLKRIILIMRETGC